MPIQVVSTYRKIPAPPVDLITAGNDIFPFCDVVVTLTATVDPILNLPGHEIFWEQLSGASVVLLTPTQLTTSYNQLTNDVTDKEFRITIDQGTLEEQTDEIIVYATPTSLPTTSFPAASWNGIPSDAVIDLSVDTGASIPVPQNVRDVDVVVTPLFDVVWSIPPDVILQPFVVGYELFENSGGSPLNFTSVATYDPGDTLLYAGGPHEYYVITNFVVNGVAPFQSSSAVSRVEDFVDAIVPLTDAVDDILEGPAYSTVDLTVTSFPNTVHRSVDESFGSFSLAISSFIRYTINSVKAEESSTATGISPTEAVIVRTDPGGIGGG